MNAKSPNHRDPQNRSPATVWYAIEESFIGGDMILPYTKVILKTKIGTAINFNSQAITHGNLPLYERKLVEKVDRLPLEEKI